MHFPMVINWWEKKECGHDAKEGADMDSVHSAVPLKSVGLNLLRKEPRTSDTLPTPPMDKMTHFCENITFP